VNVLAAKRPSKPTIKGCDTNNDTEPTPPEKVPSYVTENMVGTRRLELLTSTGSMPHIGFYNDSQTRGDCLNTQKSCKRA
jgi:hypothetical protein